MIAFAEIGGLVWVKASAGMKEHAAAERVGVNQAKVVQPDAQQVRRGALPRFRDRGRR